MIFLELVFIITVVASIIMMPICILILRITLDRRIRKQLPQAKTYNNYPDWYFGFGRAIIFGYASILDYVNDSWAMQNFYEGFDVKNFANAFEKSVAYCFLFGAITLIGGGAIYTLLEVFGVIQIN